MTKVRRNRHSLVALIALFLGVLISPLSGYGQSADFHSNSQHLGMVSTGAGGACSLCPGFNPTLPGGLLQHVDANQCPGNSSSTPCVAPYFDRLGNGAVTDNMFGVVSSATVQVSPILGNPDVSYTICGTVPTAPTNLFQTLAGLNCGGLRYDPATQGVVNIPAGNNTIPQTGSNIGMNADFNPSNDAHTGILLQNTFQWKNPATDPCGAPTAPPASCTTASFHLFQTGGILSGQAGTLAAPGPGAETVDFYSSWSTSNTSATTFNLPTINWSYNQIEPNAAFWNPSPPPLPTGFPCQITPGQNASLSQCGSFTYIAAPVDSNPNSPTFNFPSVSYPLGNRMSSTIFQTIP